MNDNSTARLWFMRAMFASLSAGIIFLHLLPLQTSPQGFVAPDLVLALGLCWALRRPEFVPALLVAGVMLFADLMLSRPPGLYAALSLLAVEVLKARAGQLRDMPFSVEWATAAMAIIAIILAYRICLALLIVEQLAIGTALLQILFTILCYPVVIGISWLFFRLRKPSLGDVNALGQRL